VAIGLAWLVVLRRVRLPAPVWLWNRARPVRSVLWTAVCGVLLLPLAFMLVVAADSGHPLMVPLLAVLIYLVLSAHAAALSGTDDPLRSTRTRPGRTTGAIRG
jgi:hypothetical protein